VSARRPRSSTGLIAQYGSLESTRQAIESLRGAGFEELEVYSPFPAPELEEAMGIHSSPVRLWALIGGITGCTLGFLLPAGASLAYPMVTQGKPIVAIPVFIVIMFELTDLRPLLDAGARPEAEALAPVDLSARVLGRPVGDLRGDRHGPPQRGREGRQ
jgi:hypothetical protein